MAKRSAKKTKTKKKTTTRKKVAARASATRSRPAAKKKTSRKKTPAKKAPAKKKTPARRVTSKKKAVSKKKAASKKKTASKKKAVKKKAPAGKVASKKKAAPAKAVSKKTGRKAAAESDARKKKKKKKTTRGKSLGARSVAEAASVAEADAQGYVYINGRRVRMISTKGQAPPARKTRAAKKAENSETEAKEPAKPIKTSLTAKELRHYRGILLLKRAELVGDLSAMEEAALQARGGNLSHLPIHMADIGTDTFDQDFNLGLAESERQRLREIDDALRRIENKTYGVCQMTGKPIPEARLEAKPWAKYTIEAARSLEGRWRG